MSSPANKGESIKMALISVLIPVGLNLSTRVTPLTKDEMSESY